MKSTSTKKLVTVAMLLAICIVSQFFKNLSVYITGPIVNTCIVIAVLSCGPLYGILLSLITPVTAFLITASPIMSAIPLIIPCIMIGNTLLSSVVGLASKFIKKGNMVALLVGGIGGALVKAGFMTAVISYGLIPAMLPEAMASKMGIFQTTFSITQLITAGIGVGYAFIIWPILKKIYKNELI